MEYRVLGPLEVHNGQGPLPLAGAKQRALLALLLVHANHVLSRDQLIDELWGDEPPETAVQSLQVYVSRLRKLLPAETLLTRPPGYQLAIEPAELDLHRFERLLSEGRDALAEGDPRRAATALHDALGLWRGPALAEFAFEPFAQAEIGRLESLRLAAVEERIEADLALGRHADLIGELEALVAENPYRERLRGQLMLALYRSGRQAEALDAYRNARRALVDELGIEPSAALQRLEKSILVQDEDLDPPAYRGPSARPPPPLERKLVTVLFADLAMANELDEDPERTETFLAEVHREAEAEIEAAGGTVERGIAGALIATFGAAHAREEDHALRAVSAALATRKRLGDVFGETLWVRMSVESGEVILGRPGSFVTGTPVVAAARLVRSAGPNEIVVGERAATATAGAFDLQQRDGAYLLGAALAPTRSPAQISRRRRRRRLLLLAGALLVVAAVASAAVIATRDSPVLVAPNSVGIIDPATNKVVGHLPVGRRPDSVAVGENSVWVANLDDKTLMRIDPEKRTVARTIQFDATPTGLAVGFGAVWVAHGLLGTVSRVAPQYTGVETIRPPFTRLVGDAGAHGTVAVGAGSVWVAFGDSSVSRIDPGVAAGHRHHLRREHAFRHRVRRPARVWVANRARQQRHALRPVDEPRRSARFGVGTASERRRRRRRRRLGDRHRGQRRRAIDPGLFGSTTTSRRESPRGHRVWRRQSSGSRTAATAPSRGSIHGRGRSSRRFVSATTRMGSPLATTGLYGSRCGST